MNLKIKEYNNKKNKKIDDKLNFDKNASQKDLESIKKEEINLKLFLVNHPLISIFKEKININEIKQEIKNEYLSKMKDNTKYKYSPPSQIGLQTIINSQFNNVDLLESENEFNEVEEENDDDYDNAISGPNEIQSVYFSDNSGNSDFIIENENNNNNNNLNAANLEGYFEEVGENNEHIQDNENNNLNIQNNNQIVNNIEHNNNDNNNAPPENENNN